MKAKQQNSYINGCSALKFVNSYILTNDFPIFSISYYSMKQILGLTFSCIISTPHDFVPNSKALDKSIPSLKKEICHLPHSWVHGF